MLNEADEFTTLREGLTQLADRAGPPSSIDVAAARESGRRALRVRHGSWAGGGVAVLTAGALCAVLLHSASHGSATAPGTPAASHPSNTATPVPMRLQGDPVSLHLVLGDVPAGYQELSAMDLNDMMMVAYLGRLSEDSGGTNTISLEADDPGDPDPEDLVNGSIVGGPASVRVNGQSGQLVTSGPGPGQQGTTIAKLTWHDRAGRRYTLIDLFEPGVDVRAQMLALADSVTVSSQPVPQPFYFSNLPPGLGYVGAQGSAAGSNQFGPEGYEIDFGEVGDGTTSGVSFTLQYTAGADDSPPPSALNRIGPSCENLADGWQLCVNVTGPMPADVAAQGGLTGLLADATVLDPDQPQSFTTRVIR